MWKSIAKLFDSKKFRGFIIGIVLEVVVASGLVAMEPEVKVKFMEMVAALTGGYVLAQGAADIGKEKAKVEKGQ